MKLILVVVDSLRTDMLHRAVAEGAAPTFAKLLDRGTLIEDCVSSFPSVTPVCTSEITTGVGPDRHRIPGMNWYHRAERRYVEYGSSLEATRAFGLFRTLYDTVYNMNMAHLSHEVETVFETVQDSGLRTACTPFLVYRGRTRHELTLEGLLRGVALAAGFRHAVWGPDELFYGELYTSRRVPCKPTLARPGTRDEYSACVGEELIGNDLFDFMLFSLPDNDHHSHRFGPEASVESIAVADASFARLVSRAGGIDALLADYAVIVMADHAQSSVEREFPIAAGLGEEWRVLAPNSETPGDAELAVGPSARAAGVYVLAEGRRAARLHERVRGRLAAEEDAELLAWLSVEGKPAEPLAPGVRGTAEPADSLEAVVVSQAGELRFRPGAGVADLQGDGWDLEGDREVLDLSERDGTIVSERYPNGLARLWAALRSPQSGDILVSLAPGAECVDWGGASHVGGGSHGALHVDDSLVPVLGVGLADDFETRHEQWTLRDIAPLVTETMGLSARQPALEAGA